MKSKSGTKIGRTISLHDGQRVPATVITIKSASEPRLRFDRTALGFVARLQKALAESAPRGKTVVVTCTAPIRQDSKTSMTLEAEIDKLIALRKTRLEATILGNGIQVRILKGGPGGLIGFVHNPQPGAEVLFDLTRALLRSLDSRRSHPRGDPVLLIRCEGARTPVSALLPICNALRLGTVFTSIFVGRSDGLRLLGPSRRGQIGQSSHGATSR